MLYYWLHTLYIFLGSKFFWSKKTPIEDITRTRRVSILDCEGFRFMSNSKYFYYMDLIRFEILFRSELYDLTIKKGIFPVLGSQKIIYKKPLKRWQKFTIHLHLEGWDEKWVYHKQVFKVSGEVYAVAYTRAAFWKNKKPVNIDDVLSKSKNRYQHVSPSQKVIELFENDSKILKEN